MLRHLSRALGLALAISCTAVAYIYKPVLNIQTGRPDLITPLNTTTVQAGSGVTVTQNADGSITIGSTGGGGGGSSSLEVFSGPARSSPTASISLNPSDFSGMVIGGTTFYFSLNPATTDFIHNGTSPQAAEFNTTRATLGGTTNAGFDGTLTINGPSSGFYAEKINLGRLNAGVDISTNVNASFRGWTIYNDKDSTQFDQQSNRNGGLLETVPVAGLDSVIPPLTLTAINTAASPASVNVVLQSTGVSISTDTYVSGKIRDTTQIDGPSFNSNSSSTSVIGAGGFASKYQIDAGSYTGAGLTNCGDSTHAQAWNNGQWSCQLVTGSGGGGTPATPFNSVQYNNAGSFGGSGNFNYSGSSVSFLDSGGIFATYGITAASATLTSNSATGNTGPLLQMNVNSPVAASNSTGGAANITMTNSTGTAVTIYSNRGGDAQGNMLNIRVDNKLFPQNGIFMDYRGASAAVTIKSSNVPTGFAFNIIGQSTATSTMQLSGAEANVGTFKITHSSPTQVQSQDDSNASVLSLQLSGVGTNAQGLFIDAPTTTGGKLLNIRNTGVEQFVIGPDGTAVEKYGLKASTMDLTSFGVTTTSASVIGSNGLSINSGGLTDIATGSSFSNIASFSTSTIGTPLVSISTQPAVLPADYELTLTSAATPIMVLGIQADGHLVSSGTTPSMGTCGTNPAVSGTDMAGIITVGAGVVTSCTLNFANAWANPPVCTMSVNSVAVTGDISSISTTAITFGFSATLATGNVWYICVGQKG